MRVLVTGANGYIGSAVAAAYARAGHQVHGLVRSDAKGRALAAAEVLPVIGDMDSPASYRAVAERCEVLIHCAADYSERYFELDRVTMDTLLEAAAEAGQRRQVIYTSGVWLYGGTEQGMVDEASPLDPPEMVAPRAKHERLVLDASRGTVRTAVVRPGCVYGGRGGLTAGWFSSARAEGAARVVGDGANRWAMVHQDDLADAYLRLGEAMIGGEVFNVTDRSRFTVLECARAASHAAGAGGEVAAVSVAEAARELGPMAECLALDQHVDSRKAVRLLAWQPRHGGFVDGVQRYFAAWRASQPTE